MLGKGVFGLARQRYAIDQEQHTGEAAGLEKALDEGGCGAGLAGAGGHLDQQLAPPGGHLAAQGVYAVDLVVAARNARVYGYGQRVALHLGRGGAALQVGLREEGLDGAREGVALPFPESDFLAVGEKDVGHAQLAGIAPGLRLGLPRADGGTLGLDHGQGAAVAVAQHVVGAAAIGQHHLEADGAGVEHVPTLVLELGVDPDARERFVGGGHEGIIGGGIVTGRAWATGLQTAGLRGLMYFDSCPRFAHAGKPPV